MTIGMIIGRRRILPPTQPPTERRIDLLQLVGVGDPAGGGLGRAPCSIRGITSSKTSSSSTKPRAVISGPAMTLPVIESTTTMTEMKPSSRRMRRSLSSASVGLPDGRAVDVDVAAGHRPRRSPPGRRRGRRPRRPRRRRPGCAGRRSRTASSALATRWRHSPCTGITLLRLDDVVAVEELAGAGVPRDVHLGVALVHDVGAEADQAVDDAVDGVLVAGDQRAREQHGVAGADLDPVVAVGHPRQRGHRLALGLPVQTSTTWSSGSSSSFLTSTSTPSGTCR